MKHLMYSMCSPSLLFLITSILTIIVSYCHTFSFESALTLGEKKAEIPMTAIVYISAGIGIVLWTLSINKICKLGYSQISWAMFIIPSFIIVLCMGCLIAMKGVDRKSVV
jgi:hypothetical protein